MKVFLYYTFIFPIIFIISILPFPLLYGLADFLFVLIYYVLGYRKKVVRENLQKSFPEKSPEELLSIERKYYRYMCDLILESLKGLTISEKEIKKRCRFNQSGVRVFDAIYEQNKSCLAVLGHFGNWEWAGSSFGVNCKHKLYIIYHPLSNKQFDLLMQKIRTRFGNGLYAMNEVLREMIKNRNEITATAFVSDQTPPPETAYWTNFLHQDTPVFWGIEKIAKKMNYPVVFVSMSRIKRGYYEINAELLCQSPQTTSEGEITELHTKKLELEIQKQPEIWLWSHRRWKHKRI